MMKILVDALFLRPGENGGGETYIRGLLSALSAMDRENSYLILVTKGCQDTFSSLGDNFQTRVASLTRDRVALRLGYEQVVLPMLARRWRPDLAFFPANMMSLGVAALSIPSVVTVHDASFDYYQKSLPGYESSLVLNLRARLAKWAARRATQVVADSEFGCSEICRTTGIPRNKVAVVPLGAPEFGGACCEPLEVFSHLGISKPYILAVGRIQKHKNFDRLVRAFAAAKKKMSFPHELVIAGRPGTGLADLETTIRSDGARDCVRLTGFLEDAQLATLYREADVFAMPSLYEGFGLPVLEAMKAGVPVIAAAVCSLPEVGGNAALFCDPWDEASIAETLCEILSNKERARDLARKGRVHAGMFTWERTARQMLEIFRVVAQQGNACGGSVSCVCGPGESR